MSEPQVLACPTCGAKLTIKGDEAEVTCSYCGNPVIVPAELRSKPAVPATLNERQPYPVVLVQQSATAEQTAQPSAVAKGAGCSALGCFVVLGVLIPIAAVIISFLPPGTLTGWMVSLQGAAGTGYARQVSVFGDTGTGPGLFQDARHVAVDGKGFVYVADRNTLRIQRFDGSGKFQNLWTINDAKAKYGPSQVEADRDGNVYVPWNGVLLRYDGVSGELLGTITGTVTSQTHGSPEQIDAIALMANGDIQAITAEGPSDDLVHFDRNGKVESRIQNIVSSAKNDAVFVSDLHPAVDGLGNVYVVDDSSDSPYVYRYSPAGKYVSRFGGKGKQPGQFNVFVDALALDGQSRL